MRFAVQDGVGYYAVFFHQVLCSFVVAFRFYALYFRQQFSDYLAQSSVVVYSQIVLSIRYYPFDGVCRVAFFIYPCGYQLAVAHVRFFDAFIQWYAHQLRHQAVQKVMVILRLEGFHIG